MTLSKAAPATRNFGFLVQDVARQVKRHFERRARQTGLPITRRQASVLISVSLHEGVSQAEIASLLNMEPISLVRILDKLCEEGLVQRQPHPTDRRVRTLWLTEAAQAVLARIVQINRDIQAEAFAGLNPPARDALIDAIAMVRNNLTIVAEAAAEPVDAGNELAAGD